MSNNIEKLKAEINKIQDEMDEKRDLILCHANELYELRLLRDYLLGCLKHAQNKEGENAIPSND